jgi:hypothetical protein
MEPMSSWMGIDERDETTGGVAAVGMLGLALGGALLITVTAVLGRRVLRRVRGFRVAS